jgi:hypothetical protein
MDRMKKGIQTQSPPGNHGRPNLILSILCIHVKYLRRDTQVRRFRQHRHSVGEGHVYQGRYKNFLVQNDRHYLTLLRYVEANALRAKLVKRAQDWPWSSLTCPATSDGRILLSRGPLAVAGERTVGRG